MMAEMVRGPGEDDREDGDENSTERERAKRRKMERVRRKEEEAENGGGSEVSRGVWREMESVPSGRLCRPMGQT